MSDATVQIIRTVVQTLWAAVLGLAVVDQWLADAGLDPEWANGVAVTLTMAAVVAAGRWLPRLWRGFGVILNGIDRPPAYEAAGTGRK